MSAEFNVSTPQNCTDSAMDMQMSAELNMRTPPNCTALVMGIHVSAELNVRYPLPDSYVQSLTMRHLNKTEVKYDGKDVCLLKSFLIACLKAEWNCRYKDLTESETVALYEMFEKLVLC